MKKIWKKKIDELDPDPNAKVQIQLKFVLFIEYIHLWFPEIKENLNTSLIDMPFDQLAVVTDYFNSVRVHF